MNLIMCMFVLRAIASSEQYFFLDKNKWETAFISEYNNQICQNTVLLSCYQVSNSECVSRNKSLMVKCSHELKLPSKLPVGIISREIGYKIGKCISTKFVKMGAEVNYSDPQCKLGVGEIRL